MTPTDSRLILDTATKAVTKACGRTGWRVTQSDLDDIRSSAIVKILESFNADKGDLAGFTYRVAFNMALDFLRNRGNRRMGSNHVALATTDDDGAVCEVDLIAHTPNPLQALLAKRRVEAVERALGNLSQAEIDACLADSDAPATGAERIRKHRAIDKIQEVVVA